MKLIKQKKTDDLPSFTDSEMSESEQHLIKSCIGCMLGKGHRDPWGHTGLHRGTAPFHTVFADTVGPIRRSDGTSMQSRGGYQYVLVMVDDYTGLLWAKPLISKADVADAVIDWHKLQVAQFDRKLVEFHSDNGTEFLTGRLQSYFRSVGVRMTQQTKHTPQMNGIAERANRTVLETARAMLAHAGLPKSYWPFAMVAAVFAYNKVLINQRTQKTAYEAYTGTKPSLKKVKVFGCDAHYYVHDEDRNKMDNKMRPCIHLGWSIDKHSYIVLDPALNKVVISKRCET